MKSEIFKGKYPIYKSKIAKSECRFDAVEEIVDYLEERVREHPVAVYIATFDHYKHTKSLAEGSVAPEIEAATDVVFCFGKELNAPEVLAVRPRSIGVCELSDSFVISFMEAPNPQANEAMTEWVESIKKS